MCLVAVIAVVYSAIRLTSAFGVARPPFTKYLLQRAVFGSFGALAVPWHQDVVQRTAWLPLLTAACVVVLLSIFFMTAGSTRRMRLAVGAARLVLVPIAPVFPFFFIAPDLQASRFLYTSTIGWALLLAVIAAGPPHRWLGQFSCVTIAIIVCLSWYGTTLHLTPWVDASEVRDRVERAAVEAGMDTCPLVRVGGLPDSIKGAYILRNGASEAFARDLGVVAVVSEHLEGPCSFRWSETERAFMRPSIEK